MAKVNTDIFLQACVLPADASVEVKDFVKEVARNHLDDFSSAHTGYFSIENKLAISKMAGEKFCAGISGQANRAEAQKLWSGVVRDFHANNNWNFGTQAKPEKVLKPKSAYSIGWKYFWTFFNSIVLIKTAILFLGAEAAENPNPMYTYILWAAITASFLNLFWFAFRAYRQEEKDKQQGHG